MTMPEEKRLAGADFPGKIDPPGTKRARTGSYENAIPASTRIGFGGPDRGAAEPVVTPARMTGSA
jgi:hypothetical protein